MAGRIQGITVEIGGDTTKLQTALKGVNTEIRNTQSQLRDVDKLLKLDPGNTELLAQKHRLLGDAVKETKEKLETLKTAAEQAEQALKDGTITQEQYDGLQREIAETEAKLKSLEEQAKSSATALAGGVLRGISLFSEINRYTLEDAIVELFYHLQLADGSYETIPMGIFEVSEANRKAKCLEIKAYDFMVRFEKAFSALESIGNAYDFMVLCSNACKVDLAQDRETIEAMPNGSENLSIYSDNDIETYRDVLFYVGQVLGGFFVINRAGKLELRKYGNEPVLLVERKHRFSSSFSDFITRYTAVSSTNLRTQIAEYYALEVDDRLTMNLGVNPMGVMYKAAGNYDDLVVWNENLLPICPNMIGGICDERVLECDSGDLCGDRRLAGVFPWWM